MHFATRCVSVPGLGIDFEVLDGDEFIGPAIEKGSWADDETRLFRAHVGQGSRVVDLGANVGWFSVQAVLAGATVEAFEPVREIAAICQRNVERAMEVGPGRGRVHALAAGAERDTAQIALAPENHGDNRVVQGDEAPDDMQRAELVTIEIAPVDEIVTGPVDFLKVDTQGSEWLAVSGAQELLASSPDLAILLEFWPYALRGASAEQLLDHLFGLGFSLGKATDAPFTMTKDRILGQMSRRDPVRGGIDLYGTRGRKPFHVLGAKARLKGLLRSFKED